MTKKEGALTKKKVKKVAKVFFLQYFQHFIQLNLKAEDGKGWIIDGVVRNKRGTICG